jgi:hypothetical protein
VVFGSFQALMWLLSLFAGHSQLLLLIAFSESKYSLIYLSYLLAAVEKFLQVVSYSTFYMVVPGFHYYKYLNKILCSRAGDQIMSS